MVGLSRVGYVSRLLPVAVLISERICVNIEFRAPEYSVFSLNATNGVHACTTGEQLSGNVLSLVHGLQACLSFDWCGHVLYEPANKSAQLCKTVELLPSQLSATCQLVASRRRCDDDADAEHYAATRGCIKLDANGLCNCGPGLYSAYPRPG